MFRTAGLTETEWQVINQAVYHVFCGLKLTPRIGKYMHGIWRPPSRFSMIRPPKLLWVHHDARKLGILWHVHLVQSGHMTVIVDKCHSKTVKWLFVSWSLKFDVLMKFISCTTTAERCRPTVYSRCTVDVVVDAIPPKGTRDLMHKLWSFSPWNSASVSFCWFKTPRIVLSGAGWACAHLLPPGDCHIQSSTIVPLPLAFA